MGINRWVGSGRLVKDPATRYTQNNTPVCNFTIAIDRYVKADAEKQTDFIPIVAWSKTAEFCQKYFTKGRKIIVDGRVQTRNWDDSEGKKHYVTEVIAEHVDFADGKKENTSSASSQQPMDNGGNDGFEQYDEDNLPF